ECERPAHRATFAKEVDDSLSLGIHLGTLQIRQPCPRFGIKVGRQLRLRIRDEARRARQQNHSAWAQNWGKSHSCFSPPSILLPFAGKRYSRPFAANLE